MGTDGNKDFFSLSPIEYTSLAFAVSLLLAENLDKTQRGTLGNFFTAIGINLLNLTPDQWQL